MTNLKKMQSQMVRSAARTIETRRPYHADLPAKLRDLADQLENESRQTDSGVSRAHVSLAYWMGRTLGNGSRTLASWVELVTIVAGKPTLAVDLTGPQAARVLELANLPDLSEPDPHMKRTPQ